MRLEKTNRKSPCS